MPNKSKASKPYAGLEMVSSGKPTCLCRVKYCRTKRAIGRTVCHKHHIMAWRMTHPLESSFATLRDHAKRRKIPFTLTIEQFKKLVVTSGYLDKKGNHKEDLHIDRIRPLEGYHANNVQILTCSENSAKGATKDKRAYVEEKIARYRQTKEQEEHQRRHLHRYNDENYISF